MRITLVSEGTYPFAMGGVSVWFDQLIRGLPEHQWRVVALTVDGNETAVWEAPDNLVGVRTIPLWGPHRFAGRPRVGDEFVSAFSDLVVAMMTPMAASSAQADSDRRSFLGALERLHALSQQEDVANAMTSSAALTVLMDEWNRVYGDGLSLADALQVVILLEHMLRPLFAHAVATDIVHCSMNGLSMLVAMAAKWSYGTPVLMTEHGIYLRERYLAYVDEDAPHVVKVLILSFFRLLAGAGYLVADALAPHSSYNRRWQLENGAAPETMWTMYNGVSPFDFPVASTEPERPTVVFMGRIDPLKDLHTLIRAFRLVLREMPEAQLRIFGGTAKESISYAESCVRLVDELDLAGSVTFEGRVDSPVEAYHAGSIVALSSISEGFPYTVVEAMACGRTVVCTDVGGVKEAVAACGRVVPPRDPAAFASACLQLLRDDSLRRTLAADARERILEHFTLDHSLSAYARLYEELAPQRPRSLRLPPLLEWTALDSALASAPQGGR